MSALTWTRDENGVIIKWVTEMRRMKNLTTAGLDKSLLNIGDQVSADVWLVRNGDRYANALSLTLPSGRSFDVSDNWP